MTGKHHKLHLKDNVVRYAAHTPINVPHYWENEIKQQLDKDVELGMLQKVPVGEPTEWCMRIVPVAKQDGKPCRTVDFQPSNKYCDRETHHTLRPFNVVSNIPSQHPFTQDCA